MLVALGLLLAACGGETAQSAAPDVSSPPDSGAPTGPSASCEGEPQEGGVARIINEGGGTNPITQNEVLVWTIFDALVQQDITGALHPGLAESWDISEDGLTYTFNLRQDALWTDGEPVDADDVVFTFDKVMDPDVAAINRRWFVGALESWQAVDQFTVEFTLNYPASPILAHFAQQRIAPESLMGDLTAEEINTQYQQEAPVTSGPFKWVETVPGQVVIVERNDDYYFPRGSNDYRYVPWLDGIEFHPWGDPQANVLAMIQGERDAHVLTMTRSEHDQLDSADGVSVEVFPVGIYSYLMLNNEHPLFEDATVRQALIYALDRESVVTELLGPIGELQHSFVDPTSWAYNPDVPEYSYDPDRARQLLADAGWEPGSDGILTKDGERFAFEALVIQAAYGSQVAEPFQANLQDVGIELTIRNVPTFQEMATALTEDDFVAALNNDGYEVYPDRRHRWHSDNLPPAGVNVARYQNPELDALLDEAWTLPEGSDEQRDVYFEMQEILATDLPWIPLYYPLMVQATSERLCGTEAGSVYFVQTASKWWINEP